MSSRWKRLASRSLFVVHAQSGIRKMTCIEANRQLKSQPMSRSSIKRKGRASPNLIKVK